MSTQNDKLRQKEEARRLYVEKGYNYRQINTVMEVSYQTIMRWNKQKNEDGRDWKAQRIEFLKAPADSRDTLLALLNQKIEDIKKSGKLEYGDSDQIVKIVKSIKILEKDYDRLSATLHTMTDFAAFIRKLHKQEPDTLPTDWIKSFDKVLQKYTQNCIERFGR